MKALVPLVCAWTSPPLAAYANAYFPCRGCLTKDGKKGEKSQGDICTSGNIRKCIFKSLILGKFQIEQKVFRKSCKNL